MLNLSRKWQSINSLLRLGLFSLLLFGLASCNLNSSSSVQSANQLTVVLHDAPAIYSSVILNVKSVEVKGTSSSSWIPLNSQPFSVDLLSLINGYYVIIGQKSNLPDGTYDQLRLTLGSGNQVWINSSHYNLAADTTSAITIPINSQINQQNNSAVVLDFDVARSVLLSKPDSTFSLKPVITANELSNTGNIQGSVYQTVSQPVIYAIDAGDTVSSTYTDQLGNFEFFAIKAGTYQITVQPRAGSYKDTTLTGVQVTAGNPQGGTVQLGSISLHAQ